MNTNYHVIRSLFYSFILLRTFLENVNSNFRSQIRSKLQRRFYKMFTNFFILLFNGLKLMCNVPLNTANRNHQCFQCLSHLRKINKGKNYIWYKRNMLALKEIDGAFSEKLFSSPINNIYVSSWVESKFGNICDTLIIDNV